MARAREVDEMSPRWIGMVVVSDKVTFVNAEVRPVGPIVVRAEHTWVLGTGERAAEYRAMQQRFSEYAADNQIARAILRASEQKPASPRRVHFETAELRGAIMCALAASVSVECVMKSSISRTLGNWNVDDVVANQVLWSQLVCGVNLTAAGRAAAIYVLYRSKRLESVWKITEVF